MSQAGFANQSVSFLPWTGGRLFTAPGQNPVNNAFYAGSAADVTPILRNKSGASPPLQLGRLCALPAYAKSAVLVHCLCCPGLCQPMNRLVFPGATFAQILCCSRVVQAYPNR